MNDRMLMIASAAAALLIAFSEFLAKPSEVPAHGATAATLPQLATTPSRAEAVAHVGANGQMVGATGQADMPPDR